MSASPAAAKAAMADPVTGTVSPFHGQILDGDGHMYMAPEVANEVFAGLPESFVTTYLRKFQESPQFSADRARNRREFWHVKGLGALGAVDAAERLEALNHMGVKAQLVFSNNNTCESVIADETAYAGIRRYNDYALAFQKSCDNRAQMVLPINMRDPDVAMAELDRVIRNGARAIGLNAIDPPANVSPSHELWDPFWARLQEADVVATLHLSCGGLIRDTPGIGMFPDRNWGNSRVLKGQPVDRPGGEEAISPYFMLVAQMPAELYLQTMVMGKVFERFPRLRLGIIEIGANWVGPCVERMDLWVEFMGKVGQKYEMKPSEYVKRNVRVTPFWHENLPLMIDRYGLEDVYIYSTDYPHLEGSRDPVGKFAKWLDRMPAEYVRKFYIENPRLLFPHVT
jgi:predicted TIM-barrel fold metal-dependent hydrolase